MRENGQFRLALFIEVLIYEYKYGIFIITQS